MRKNWIWALLVLGLALPTWNSSLTLAQESEKAEKKSEKEKGAIPATKIIPGKAAVAEQEENQEEKEEISPSAAALKNAREAFDQAMADFSKKYREMRDEEATQEELREFVNEKLPKGDDEEFGFMKVAEDFPGTDEAAEALIFLAQRSADKSDFIEELLNQYIESPKLASLPQMLVYGQPSKQSIDHMKCLVEKSPHREVQGNALLALADYQIRLQRYKERGTQYLDEDTKAFLESFEYDEKDVIELYGRVAKEFADLGEGRRSLKTRAESAIFELQYLSIGKVAPDIEGEDLDGVAFKLSDYRGKVVMIDFWGDLVRALPGNVPTRAVACKTAV